MKPQPNSQQIEAMISILEDISKQSDQIIPQLKTLQQLEDERVVARAGLKEVNLQTQARILDKLIELYDFLENDVAINSIRLRHIAENFLAEANKAKLTGLVKLRKKKWKV